MYSNKRQLQIQKLNGIIEGKIYQRKPGKYDNKSNINEKIASNENMKNLTRSLGTYKLFYKGTNNRRHKTYCYIFYCNAIGFKL